MLFVLILSKGSPKTDNYSILSFQTKFDNESEWGQKTKSTIKRSQRFPQIRIWQLTINDNIYMREPTAKSCKTSSAFFHTDKISFHPIGSFLLYGGIWIWAGHSLIMSSGRMSQSLGERNAWCLRERKKQSPEKVPFGERSKFTRPNSIYKHATQRVQASSLIAQRHVIGLFVSVKRLSNKRGVITRSGVSSPQTRFRSVQALYKLQPFLHDEN